MLEIVKKRITLTKGDDASVWLRPRYKDKSIYTVQEGDRAYFRIKTTTDILELECNVNVDANKIVVSFVPDDTKDMLPGIYRYEAELVTSWGMHYTFLADQTFILGKELEKHVSNANSTNGSYGNNIPSVDGELEDEPIIDGDIQPTNPSLDYEILNHLPKINGNTLKGDMSNEDLGIPTALADMTDDEEHRVVTDEQISDWNNKVEDDNYVHTDNNFDDTYKSAIDNLGTAATKNVPESGNASSTEVVLGSDTRLTDARPASDVSDWAKQPTKPSYNASEISGLGTAAVKNFTTSVIEDSADLVTSGAVKSAIDSAVSSLYKPAGNKTCAELVSALLIQANLGNTYNMSDSGVTTADFVEGAGHPINVGDNVAIVEVSGAYKFDILSGMVDLSNYVQKSATSGLIKNDGSIDTTAYAKQSEMSVTNGTGVDADKTTIQLKNGTSATVLKTHQDISGKANKSEMSITDGTGVDADKVTIQLKDGASTKVLKTHQDISGKAEKSEMSVTDGTGIDADKTTIQLKSGLSATVLKTHQDISGKVDKVEGKGLSTNDYDDTEKGKVADATNKLSAATQTVEGNPISFTTLSAQNAVSTIIDLEPIQDLHGYDKPWVGGAGKNKFDGIYPDIETAIKFKYIYVGNGTFTLSTNMPLNSQNATNLFFLTGQATSGPSMNINGVWNNQSRTISSTDGYVTIAYRSRDDVNPEDYNTQLEAGSTATSYEPYENICPISGRTEVSLDGCDGKNLFNKNAKNSSKGYVDNKFLQSSGAMGDDNAWYISEYIRLPLNTDYISISGVTANSPSVCFYDGNKTYISGNSYYNNMPRAFSIPSNTEYLRLSVKKDSENQVQVEFGSTPSSYTPYVESNALNIQFGQTVYGGTLDVENGVLVVDKGYITYDGSNDEEWNLTGGTTNYHQFVNIISNAKDNQNAISNRFQRISISERGSKTGLVIYADASFRFALADNEMLIDSVPNWRTWLGNNNVEVCYELAEPITIQLTPHTINLLKGVNNISTDGDKITLTYRDGSVATLADLTSAVDNLDSKIDESKILTDTVTGDKYILVVTNGVLDIQQISN